MEKEPRVKFFAFYPDDFYEDERVIALSDEDQRLWLALITKMFRHKAEIPDGPRFIAKLLGISVNRAAKLVQTLLDCRLLVKEYQKLVSPRLRVEYQKAKAKYEQRSNAGKISAANKHGKIVDFLQRQANDRCNDRSNEDQTE